MDGSPDEADEADDEGLIDGVEFYWRQGCGFCMSLHRKLERHGIAMDKRNIWEDPDAAAFVRSVANGNETVPTVRVADHIMVNPNVHQVMASLQEHAPHLVPTDYEPEPPGAVSRLLDRLLGD